MQDSKTPAVLNIPTAIIIAGAIVAGSIIFTMKPAGNQTANNQAALAGLTGAQVKDVTITDHILGNPNAKIKIIEYSDPSCPFCKMFHNTMRQIMNEYGQTGDVAWVYRHFPLDKPGTRPDGTALHPNAGHEAQAFECAAALGGNDKFWAYANKLYEITPSVTNTSPNGLDQNQLYAIAKDLGLNDTDFRNCLDSGRFKDKVEASYQEGLSIGITGTPMSYMLLPGGKQVPIEGAQPFETVKGSIDAVLADLKNK